MAELVGVSQAYLLKLVQSGQRRHVSESDAEKERICKRFFMALMLNDVIQEVTSTVNNCHHTPKPNCCIATFLLSMCCISMRI